MSNTAKNIMKVVTKREYVVASLARV